MFRYFSGLKYSPYIKQNLWGKFVFHTYQEQLGDAIFLKYGVRFEAQYLVSLYLSTVNVSCFSLFKHSLQVKVLFQFIQGSFCGRNIVFILLKCGLWEVVMYHFIKPRFVWQLHISKIFIVFKAGSVGQSCALIYVSTICSKELEVFLTKICSTKLYFNRSTFYGTMFCFG